MGTYMAPKERHLKLVPPLERVTPEMIQHFVRGSIASNVPENFYLTANDVYQICVHTTPENRITQKIAYDIFSINWNKDEAEYALAYAKSTSHAKILIRYMRKLEQTLEWHDRKQKQLTLAQKEVTQKSNLPDRPAFWAAARVIFPKKFAALDAPGSLQDEIRILENNYDQLHKRQDIYLGNVIDSFTLLYELNAKRKQTGIHPKTLEHEVERHYDMRRASAA